MINRFAAACTSSAGRHGYGQAWLCCLVGLVLVAGAAPGVRAAETLVRAEAVVVGHHAMYPAKGESSRLRPRFGGRGGRVLGQIVVPAGAAKGLVRDVTLRLVRRGKSEPGKPTAGGVELVSSDRGAISAAVLKQLCWSLTADGRLRVGVQGGLETAGSLAYAVARAYALEVTYWGTQGDKSPVVGVVEALGAGQLQKQDAQRLLSTMHRSSLGAERFDEYRLQQVADQVQLVPTTSQGRKAWLDWAASGQYGLKLEQLNLQTAQELMALAKGSWNGVLVFQPKRVGNSLGFEVIQGERDFYEVLGGAHVLDQATAGVRALMGQDGKITVDAGHRQQNWESSDRLEYEAGHVVLGLSRLLANRLGYDMKQVGFRTTLFSGDLVVAGPWTADAQTRGLLER